MSVWDYTVALTVYYRDSSLLEYGKEFFNVHIHLSLKILKLPWNIKKPVTMTYA